MMLEESCFTKVSGKERKDAIKARKEELKKLHPTRLRERVLSLELELGWARELINSQRKRLESFEADNTT